jgi:hypothetical protein
MDTIRATVTRHPAAAAAAIATLVVLVAFLAFRLWRAGRPSKSGFDSALLRRVEEVDNAVDPMDN